ncbi:MAG: ABC transporter ATP-binding protein [Candidatus Thermoplasmatota archaeon]|nr:ABC transporter ATP-binding protein [Candidatus Thermoplasmatota archaeon]MCL5681176.1 ABC transporter ATP-binding protein [Candidatus Thermoplasmatota archaeon]
MKDESILNVSGLKVRFRNREKRGFLTGAAEKWKVVLDDISFSVNEGETLGIVGETGSGKSTLARTLVGIYRPVSGEVILNGKRIDYGKKVDLVYLRNNIGIVFQDPIGSLNPRLTVREIVREGIPFNRKISRKEQDNSISEITDLVGLSSSKLDEFPETISGGEKQRVSLARALVNRKKILLLDEPTSSLDVSIQAQILNLLRKLREELSVNYIFITHDFNVIKYMCDRIAVLYYGQFLEVSSVQDLYENPFHPYSAELMNANLTLETSNKFESQYEIGEPSREGCIYVNSCPKRFSKCSLPPPSIPLGNRVVKCWLYSSDDAKN